jgi:hypothetical protein
MHQVQTKASNPKISRIGSQNTRAMMAYPDSLLVSQVVVDGPQAEKSA